MMDHTAYVTRELTRLLQTYRAMPTLPLPGTPEALADHAGWMKTHEQTDLMEREACTLALLMLPPDIQALFEAVENERCRVLSIGPYFQERGSSNEPQ